MVTERLDLILIRAKTLSGEDDRGDYQSRLKALEHFTNELYNENPTLLVAPEYFLSLQPLSKEETRELLSNLRDIFKGCKGVFVPGSFLELTRKFLVYHSLRNVTPVFVDGEPSKLHYKMFCAGADWLVLNSIKKKRLRYESGKTPCVIEYEGLKIGVEVCIEHHIGGLNREYGNIFDIQIISSCGALITPSNISVNNNGYVIYTDGYLGNYTVRRISDGRSLFIDPEGEIEYNGIKAYFYKIKI